jgi:hypothetical protein
MTSTEFLPHMSRLAAAFRKDVTQATLEVYLEALGALDVADFALAVRWAIRHKTYLPSPAELLERGKHERTARVRALPPIEAAGALPEWVTESEDIDVKAMVAELLPKLAMAAQRVESIRPAPSARAGEAPPMSNPERIAKAGAELERYRAWLVQQGMTT